MCIARQIIPGDLYRHFKNKLYQVITVAEHSETGEKYVVYQALYGDFKTYVRPYDMFVSKVDREKYPNVKQVYRFEKVEAGSVLSDATQDATIADLKYMSDDSEDKLPLAGDGQVNPYLMEFFDKEGSRAQIEYLNSIRSKIDDRLVNDIAVSLDITVDEGALDDRINSLIRCLKTRARFECERLR